MSISTSDLGEGGHEQMMDAIDEMSLKTPEELKHEALHATSASAQGAGSLETLMSGFTNVPVGAELDESGHTVVNIADAMDGPAPLDNLENGIETDILVK